MPITAEMRKAWIDGRSRYAFHVVAFDRDWPWILRDGLQPRSATGHHGLIPGMSSRGNHVYLLSSDEEQGGIGAGVGVTQPAIRIDLHGLDLDRFCTDEDRIGAYNRRVDDEVAALPGFGELEWPPPKGQVAAWMDANEAIVDGPEWVWLSMSRLSFCYRGGIRRDLIEVIDPEIESTWDVAAAGDEWAPVKREVAAARYLKSGKKLAP